MKNLIHYANNVKLNQANQEKYDKIAVKKRASDLVAFTYKKTNLPDREKKAKRLFCCGQKITSAEIGENLVPFLVMRCGIRLCPSCSWIRAHKIFQNVFSIITASEFDGKEFVFLTLTIKTCRGKYLESEIDRLLSGWKKLINVGDSPFRRSFLGTFRALEVTYNPFRKDYHPHLHAMAAVEPGYFINKNYIDQPKLRKLWRDACDLDYLPQCWIKKVKEDDDKKIQDVVAEVSKYTIKNTDYINRPAVIEVLDPALKNKRLIAYGGIFKTVKARLSLPDEDDLDELPKMAVEEILKNPYIKKIVFEWQMGRYHVTLLEPSSDPADWLDPGRLAAAVLSGGQGVN